MAHHERDPVCGDGAAQPMRSPAFSRPGSSTTITSRPARRSASAVSIVDVVTVISLLGQRGYRGFGQFWPEREAGRTWVVIDDRRRVAEPDRDLADEDGVGTSGIAGVRPALDRGRPGRRQDAVAPEERG